MKILCRIGFLAGLIWPLISEGQTTDTWTRKSDFGGVARSHTIGFSIGSKGYLGLGNNGSLGNSNELWEYDQATDTWTQKADFPGGARISSTAFSIGSKGYVGLGAQTVRHKDFYEYNPSSNSWTKLNDFGGDARSSAVSFTIGNKAYVGTGDSGVTAFGRIIHFSDFWEYNPATDVWTKKADFSGGTRWRAVGFSIAGKGYIGTGTSSASDKNDFWAYDPATDTWERKADFGGYPEGAASGFSIGAMGYIGTGSDYTGAYKSDFWMYDPLADTWTQKTDFGGGKRIWTTAFRINAKGYMGTGTYGPDKKDFWEYLPDSIITHNPKNTAICIGDTFTIGFISSPTFSVGNVFTVQLSNAAGSFSAPTIIGSKTSSSNIDSIPCVIAAGASPGSGYRVRVISSLPFATGTENSFNIALNNKLSPDIIITVSDSSVCTGDSVTLKASFTNGGDLPAFQWKVNTVTVGKNDSVLRYKPADKDTLSCMLFSNAICSIADSVLSNKILITVNPLPVPTISSTGTTLNTQLFKVYQWFYKSSAILSGGNNQMLTILGDGDYFVAVTDSNGCTGISAITTIKSTGISGFSKNIPILLFPNPLKDYLTISSPKILSVKVYDLMGHLLMTENSNTAINFSHLSSGCYIVQLFDKENGNFMAVRRVLKID